MSKDKSYSYRIMGRFEDLEVEEVDCISNKFWNRRSGLQEAQTMLLEYAMAYKGQGWSLWIEEQEYESDTLVDCKETLPVIW